MDYIIVHGYSCSLTSIYITWIIVTWVVWWVPVTDMDIPVTGHESCWYAICGIPHLVFPFPVILFPFPVILFYAINRTQVLLSCYPYQVLYLFLLHCLLAISDHKANLGMGETWRLIRSYRVMYWIHIVSPTAGDGSATYQLLHELPLLDYCSPLSGGPWSQQPGVCLRPWSRVCTGYTYPIRAPRLFGFQLT